MKKTRTVTQPLKMRQECSYVEESAVSVEDIVDDGGQTYCVCVCSNQ